MSLLKKYLNVFLRTYHISITAIIAILCVAVYSIYIAVFTFPIHGNVLYCLETSQELCMIGFILQVYLAYEYTYKLKKSGIEECVFAHKNGRAKLYAIPSAILMLIPLIQFLLKVIFNFTIALISNMTDLSYYFYIISTNFLFTFLLGTLATLIGLALALKLKRVASYSIIAFIIFAITPVSDFLPGVATNATGTNFWVYKELFSYILPQSIRWESDYLYGLSTEILRWNLIIFWIFFVLFFVLLYIVSKKAKIRIAAYVLVAALCISNLYGYFLGGSLLKMGPYPDSISMSDFFYYKDNISKEKKADFTVTHYKMNMKIKRELTSAVKIFVDNKNLKSFDFTLYHGYKVTKVYDNNKNNLDYIRESDYITVKSKNTLNSITIEYSGYNPILFSNNQAVLLPGCFAYYPMAGFYKIPKESDSYNAIKNSKSISYDIKIDHAKQIHCNLTAVDGEKNRFKGNSKYMTLISGFAFDNSTEDYEIIALSIRGGWNIGPVDQELLDRLQKQVSNIEKEKGLTTKLNLKNKKVFQIPSFFYNRAGFSESMLLDDHVLIKDETNDKYIKEMANLLLESAK